MSKFKLNWGWSILLVYATFVLVFLFYFYRSFREAASNDLVVEDYYQKELVYGDVLDKKKNADSMKVQVQILNNEQGITVIFPDYLQDSKVQGNLILYKPDNKKLDKTIPLDLQNGKVVVKKAALVPGRWDISLDWKVDGKPYFIEQKLTVD